MSSMNSTLSATLKKAAISRSCSKCGIPSGKLTGSSLAPAAETSSTACVRHFHPVDRPQLSWHLESLPACSSRYHRGETGLLSIYKEPAKSVVVALADPQASLGENSTVRPFRAWKDRVESARTGRHASTPRPRPDGSPWKRRHTYASSRVLGVHIEIITLKPLLGVRTMGGIDLVLGLEVPVFVPVEPLVAMGVLQRISVTVADLAGRAQSLFQHVIGRIQVALWSMPLDVEGPRHAQQRASRACHASHPR